MDPVSSRNDPHQHLMERSVDVDQKSRGDEGWRLVDVLLSGGAPWGFTLRGGREHHEPLLLTKVEEGSKAAAVGLQVGDELVNINEVPLSGYRQEAICLVKGSHKTLSVVVKRNMKMVDIVAQKMPSENDVHVARSFLTKILRSSMRRNEPISRPHSWHSTKFNESQSEVAKTQSPPPSWHTGYDASSSSSDLCTDWEQTNLRRVSDQYSSLGSMDSLEHVPHPSASGQLSPTKFTNSVEHLGGGKRDSAYSSFSTSSGTPDYTLSKSNTASTENVLYKVSHWDSASGKHSNGRAGQSASEGVRQDDRPGYPQMPGGAEEQAGSRHSSSSRSGFGPVWHVPDKNKTASPSPPPPPPVRSDSFVATKVHDRGHVTAYPEAPDSHVHARGPDKRSEASENAKRPPESRHSSNFPAKSDNHGLYISPADNTNNNQLHTNRQYSLSTTDVRQSQPPHVGQTYYQWHYGEKSPFYSQPRTTSVPKAQNANGYYSSMQELPTNNPVQSGGPSQGRAHAASLAIDQSPESGVHSRYYSMAAPCQPVSHPMSGRTGDRKSTADADAPETGSSRNSISIQGDDKGKYPPPQPHQHSHRTESNGHSKQDDGLGIHHKLPTVTSPAGLEAPSGNPTCEDWANHRKHTAANAEPHYTSSPPSKAADPWWSASPPNVHHQGPEHKAICPKTTPMLHSLSMETPGLPDHRPRGNVCEETAESSQVRRSDRFATTLRNEIQMRRARLQKSTSAATLLGIEAEEDQDPWRSREGPAPIPADGSFTSTYKDNLKEAQARVLKATSFRRRDLELVLAEHSGAEPVPHYSSSVLPRKDVTPLPTVSESTANKSGSAGGHVTRIGGRKRFSAEKKVKSFSEPNKMHEVGMKEDCPATENRSSFAEQRKVFEASSKATFSKPMSEQSVKSYSEDSKDIRPKVPHDVNSEAKHEMRSARTRASSSAEYRYIEEGQGISYPVHKQSLLEQKRLGTFAEYEARWSAPETKATERYLSADNILDPGTEEKAKPHGFHVRSRSSPSADFYRQVPVPGRKSAEYYQLESKPEKLFNTATSAFERPSDCRAGEQPEEPELYPAQPECRPRAAPVYDRPTSVSRSPVNPAEAWPGPRKKAPERPPPPRADGGSSRWEATPPLGRSLESLATARCSPDREPSPVHIPNHSQRSRSDQTRGIEDRGQGAVRRDGLGTANPEPTSPPLVPPQEPSMPAMDEQHPPSPQFSPQRLSDKPPVSLQEDDSTRIENVVENNTAVKKVPIKIVHSESASEKESRQYLAPGDASAPAETQGPRVGRLGSLGAPEQQDYSVFCAYTRHKEPAPDPMPLPQTPEAPQVPQAPQDAEQPAPNSTEAPVLLVQEEQKREELVRDITGKDKSLADILDQSKMKTTMDLMEGIFPQEEQLLGGAHKRRKPKLSVSRNPEERKDADSQAVGVVTSSAYYSTSAPKAELLIKMKGMQEQEQEEEDTEDELDVDLANKKQELIHSLSKKLQVLRDARESLQADVLDNNTLGDEVEATVQQVCKPNELDKFRMFVGDLDKVVSLLLSLSGRLARVENALNSLDGDATAEERRTLTDKRKLLIRQHEDAKELKENLDRREGVVYEILASHLDKDILTDYEHFVKMKSALIIEQRKLEDKIKLGEEQLKCLTDSLPLEQRLPL